MPSLTEVKASNAQYAPSYVPTAVFIGGTSGVGAAMASIYARQTKGRANIIIIGRNKAAADKIISAFPAPPTVAESSGVVIKHEFIECDASVLKNVHKTTLELLTRLEKINLLVISIGGLATHRVVTEEGLDVSLVLRYYARAKFIDELIPLLSKARAAGEDAKAMTILMAASGGNVNLQDISLDSTWGFVSANTASAVYNDIMVKVQSERHPDIAFVHMYPGAVDTPALRIHWALNLVLPLAKPFLLTPEDSAQSLLYPLLSPESSKGGYWLSKKADKLALADNITDEVVQKVWDNTVEHAQLQ